MESIFHSFINIGEFLSVWQPSMRRKRSNFWHESKTRRVSNFGWHQLPGDIMESIVMWLHLSAGVRMNAVCKSWRGLLPTLADKNLMLDSRHDIPCLLLPHGEGPSAHALD